MENLPPIDAWVASSMLQKAIRRDEANLASSAAAALYRMRGNAIWRRLIAICFEDIGVANPELCVTVTELGSTPTSRRVRGDDAEVIDLLVRLMATSPKCREADYLICGAIQAPFAENQRALVAKKTVDERIELATDASASMITRSIAAWMVGETNGGGQKVLSDGNLLGLMHRFVAQGVSPPFADATILAAKRTAEPITIMGPLLSLAMRQLGEGSVIIQNTLPPAVDCGGIPSWVFDKHTATGKSAFRILLQENRKIRDCIAAFVPEFRALDLVAMSAFYADATPIRRQLVWSQSSPLYSVGLKTDMTKIGCPDDGVETIVSVVIAHLDHLNNIRQRLRSSRSHGNRNAEVAL
ncbi:hypothetical protein RMR16_010490 [Agrobacterium sp. rho-13.3]|uniref:hypothetical protein n=1 Tax=Agrobacterium sp. rho-13.3 TaxID=3072980 RepID=UPI002A0F0A0F|nr:hypothetical protein [Agrobacterium sp. rho-13.3]MDX8307808.1 hypothetical protein [Agrobacterium sp. rho-13.3]